MSTTLLRRFLGSILLLALLVLGARPAQASHLLGGEISYRYLDANGTTAEPFRYEVTVTFYINRLPGTPGTPGTTQAVRLYNRTSGAFIKQVTFTNPINSPIINPSVPAGCTVVGPSQPFSINKFVGTVTLPVSFDGFYAVASFSDRSYDITNLNAPNTQAFPGQPLTLYVSMAPPLIYNRSPVFSDTAVAIVCSGDTTISLNNAFDPDGDRLVYSFGSPYGALVNGGATFPPLPTPVPYFPGFSVANPFGTGAGNFASINATTGITKYGAVNNGKYVVAVDVSEYRTINGQEVLLGTTRRDLQLIVSTCPPTSPPVLPPVTTPRNYTIEEGQSLSIPITATQANNTHPLVLTVNSALLDGSGPFNTTFNGSTGTVAAGNLTGTATATGMGSVSGTFIFNSACGQARSTAYDLAVTVKDNGCGGKLAADLFRVTVTRAAAPTAITGPATICNPATSYTYAATGATPASYRWRVVGGTISSGQGSSAVQVLWGATTTTGTIVVKGISAYGCPTDSVTRTVTIRPLAALTVTPSAPSICLGGSTTLTVTGTAGLTYTWTGGTQTSTGATITVSPTTTTTYTVTGTDGTCTTTATTIVTVTPPPTANAGPDQALCPSIVGVSGGPSVQIGSAPIVGATYSWSPATGLSSTTVANPTVSLPNTTGAPIVQIYTLTVTVGAGCASVGTVRVTVAPAAIADAGAARTVCSGITTTPLGSTALAGYTYSWSPATGLSSTTAAQPTATLTNVLTVPVTTVYTVTATSHAGCTATSTVGVTVNPAAVATPGPAISFCSGTVSTPLGGGATAVPGTTYSWSPTTGLSDPNILNPTVTGTNTTGTPIIRTYTLTSTNANGCIATATVVVTINPAAVADAGAAKQTCSNVGIAIGGATAVTGTTYAWTPTTGLSSATVLNPTVTLSNTGSTNITQTYTLTATTANGCTATATVAVTVFPGAVATPGPAVSFCSGETRTLGAGTAVIGTTYAWSPTTGLSDPTSLTPTITLTNTTGAPITTTYTLTATTGNSCTATATVAVTVNQAAVANAGPARTTCSNVGVTIGGGTAVAGTTYAWTPTTGLSSTTVLNPTVTLPNATSTTTSMTYTLTATTAQGCAATSTVTVTVNPAAVADAGPARATCSNVGVTIGAAALAGTTYAWTPTTGLSSATASNPTVTLPNLTGAAIVTTYTLTATTANGCTATNTVAVTVNPAAVAIPGANQAVCSGATITLGAAAVTGYTYSWSPATGLSSATVANPTFTLTNTTTTPNPIVFTLTATTANGCVATGTVTVTVNPAAVANAGPAAAVCDGKRITLGTPALTGYTYSWSPATNLSSATAAQPILTGVNATANPITLTYTLTATTANGCVSTSTVAVTVNPRPAAEAITGPVSVCPTVTGIAYSVINPAATAYTWLISGGTIASGQGSPAITVDWGVASTGSFIKVFRLNAQGCSSDTTTLPITINPRLQTVRPTGPGDIALLPPPVRGVCQADGPYTYRSGAFAAGSSYSWAIVGGTQVSSFQNTVTVNWAPVTVPTIGKIVVTETSNPASGVRCLGVSDTLKVLINPSPRTNLAIVSPLRVCQTNGPVTFSLPGGFTGSTYAFLLNGTAVAGTGSTRTLNTLPAAGTYPLTVQETTTAGCAGPLYTTTFTVNPTPTAPTISGSGFVCNVTAAQQYTVANATAGSSYQWTVVGGTVTSGGTSSTITVRFNATGPYTISAAEITAAPASCVGPATTRTIIFDNPSLTLTNASVDVASNNRVILTLSAANSGSTPNPVQVMRRVAGSGTFAAIGTVAASATTYTDNSSVDASANSYEYRLDLTNGCGTLTSSAVAQTIRLVATATAGPGGRNQGSTALTWNAYVGFPVASYEIYRRTDTGASVLVTPTPAITVSGTTLQATVSNLDASTIATGVGFSQNFRVVAVGTGASPLRSNSNEAGVTFTNATKVYNVITPNHDGLNDVLVIDNINLYPGNTFTVFNRWGREVYKTTNYQNNWGSDDNLAAGSYFYLLTVPNGPSIKNWFEVVK